MQTSFLFLSVKLIPWINVTCIKACLRLKRVAWVGGTGVWQMEQFICVPYLPEDSMAIHMKHFPTNAEPTELEF